MSTNDFFNKYPGLYACFLRHLEGQAPMQRSNAAGQSADEDHAGRSTAPPASGTLNPSVHPVLILLARVQHSKMRDGAVTEDAVLRLRHAVGKYLADPIQFVRCAAAKVSPVGKGVGVVARCTFCCLLPLLQVPHVSASSPYFFFRLPSSAFFCVLLLLHVPLACLALSYALLFCLCVLAVVFATSLLFGTTCVGLRREEVCVVRVGQPLACLSCPHVGTPSPFLRRLQGCAPWNGSITRL